jgi:hypothetical protein
MEKAAKIVNTKNPGKKGGETKPYEERTMKELYEQAKTVGISGRSIMKKKALIKGLRSN